MHNHVSAVFSHIYRGEEVGYIMVEETRKHYICVECGKEFWKYGDSITECIGCKSTNVVEIHYITPPLANDAEFMTIFGSKNVIPNANIPNDEIWISTHTYNELSSLWAPIPMAGDKVILTDRELCKFRERLMRRLGVSKECSLPLLTISILADSKVGDVVEFEGRDVTLDAAMIALSNIIIGRQPK
jgi:DNA-directed RNA polymerase subunit RPC12/RpoP